MKVKIKISYEAERELTDDDLATLKERNEDLDLTDQEAVAEELEEEIEEDPGLHLDDLGIPEISITILNS